MNFNIKNELPIQTNGFTESSMIQCFSCSEIGETRLEYRCGMWTLLMCIFLQCVCGPCGLVICFMKDCKDIYHICQSCNTVVGIAEKNIKFK